MAYYNTNAWSGSPAGNQGPWDPSNQAPRPGVPAANPSPTPGFEAHRPRSGTTQAGSAEDGVPFYYQFTSVDRAVETWRKSSKLPAGTAPLSAHRDKHPRANLAPRFQPPVEFDPMRGPAAGPPQNFFPPGPPPPGPPQRFGGARTNEPDPAVQAKRRMAAQRERELRNFHQEQQFHKHLSGAQGAKSDRSMSPNTGMSENERRELIARQHRALYGEDSSLYAGDSATPRGPVSGDARVISGSSNSGFRGGSPYDSFGHQSGAPGNESSVTMPQRDGQRQSRSRANSNASPASNNANNQQLPTRTSNSSPHGSPPRDADAASTSNVAPIGTRPTPAQLQGGQKRSTPPITSPLGFGFGEQSQGDKPTAGQDDKSGNIRGGWGNGPWGGKGSLGVQAKVWG